MLSHKKEKSISLLLAGFVLLAACSAPGAETPVVTPTPTPTSTPEPTLIPASEPTEEVEELWGFPIDDTHDAFEVPTGGKLGTVLVTVEMQKEGEDEYTSILSVWENSDLTEPIQTIEQKGVATRSHKLLDANFDRYMDFCYTWFLGAKNDNSGLYVWNEEQGQFVSEKEFLGDLVIDEEEKRIYNFTNGAGSSGTVEIFQWENETLVPARRIGLLYPETLEDGTIRQEIVVEEPADGEWREIYREAYHAPDEIAAIIDAYYGGELLWYDLNYHGE